MVMEFRNIDVHYKNDWIFRVVCNRGNLEMAKWLVEIGNIDIHQNNDVIFKSAFKNACEKNSNFEIVKWLWSFWGH